MSLILRTERLELREIETSDLDALAALLGDPEVMRFWPRRQSRDEAAEWIRRQRERYARDGFGYWLALDRSSGAVAGQAGLLMQELEGERHVGLGYMLHRECWKRGLAQEASRGCMEWGRARLGLERLVCLVRPENVPSLRTAISLGFKPEKLIVYADLPHLVFARERGRSADGVDARCGCGPASSRPGA